MRNIVPRVAAVHDMSCFGRCSLAVIIPTLSTLGVQVCPLPTAVLSTHLGGFTGLEFCDFTSHMSGFFSHWHREGIQFNSIYSGFLASDQQIDTVIQFITDFAQDNPFILVDPVMGDEGKLYSSYTPHMKEQMKVLVQKADMITPNYTEACFLLGETYKDPFPDISTLESWLIRLSNLGPSAVIITGIPIADGKIVNAGYDKSNQGCWYDYCSYIPVKFPGTGDIYASVVLGFLLRGKSLKTAMKYASTFVSLAIKTTVDAKTPTREGVLLERVLPWLNQTFHQINHSQHNGGIYNAI